MIALKKQILLKISLPILAAMMLPACATGFPAKVQRFQAMSPAQGQSFAVVAGDPALKGGLEFQTYADLVAKQMLEEGYKEAASPENADLIVSLDYGVDEGERFVVQEYDPFYSPFSYGGYYGHPHYAHPHARRGYYRLGWYDPWLSGAASIRSYTVFTSDLAVNIEQSANKERIFEGKAMARSRTDNLTYLVPNLIEAMFTDFPGANGETVKITVLPEGEKQK